VLAIAGLIPSIHVDVSANFFGHGGFAPNGLAPIAGAMLTTMFTFLGTEVVTIAAAESANPAREISRAINSVVWRISLFYIGSILVILAIVPWNDASLTSVGSYQAVLAALHVPYAKLIIGALILVAVCSCLNSGIYTASRMVFSLSERGQAPAFLRQTNNAGVPVPAIIASTLAAFAGCAANYMAPAYVFQALLATTGSMALLVYLVIASTQLKLRPRLEASGGLKVRMWMHPFLGLLVVTLIVGTLVVMVWSPGQRVEVLSTLGLSTALAIVGFAQQRWKKSRVATR
jgi:GABA permease